MTARTPLADLVETRRVLVCVGAGGVGKTTVSASLGVLGAMKGASTLVLTIDPARRLANALGLESFGNKEAQVPPEMWRSAGVTAQAPLSAMMLDMKQSWDELIERHAPEEAREKILSNRFYRALSSALAGSQEYIALEKLWELRTRRQEGLLVLDTPPTAQALDFLEAPNRILDFLDNEAARWLLSPALAAGKVGFQLFNLGGSYVTKTLARLTGVEMLRELASFMLAIGGMNQGFRDRAKAVRDLLKAHETSFVLVTAPSRERMDEVVHFWEILRENDLDVAAIVVNRVHMPVAEEEHAQARMLAPTLRDKLLVTLEAAKAQAESDALGIVELKRRCTPTPLVQVPRFEQDVHDLPALIETAQYLSGGKRGQATFPPSILSMTWEK